MRAVVLAILLSAGSASAQQQDADQILKAAIDAQQHGDYDAAIRDYRRVLELRPNTFEAKVNLGAALVHQGQFDAAIDQYKSALASSPQNRAVLLNLALAYYKKGDFKAAREQFANLEKLQPNDVRTAILLGDTDLRMGEFNAAVELLTPREAANAANLDLEYVLGSALIKTGRRREGVERVEKVATGGNSADAFLLAGVTLLEMDEYERARRDLDAALNLDPKLPGIYTLAGTARDKTGDAAAAEPAFRKALEVNPNDFDANLYLGAILYKRRQMDEAKTYLERALGLKPESSMARYEYAMYKSKSGDYQGAAQDLEKLVRDDPKWLEPHVELASLYYRLHRPEDGAKERHVVDQITAEQQAQGPGKR
jgi:tetratricopeptide (TPR) repeat protein